MEHALLGHGVMMGAAVRRSLAISLALVAWGSAASANDREAERLAAAAVSLCMRADTAGEGGGRAMLRRGLALAERAVARDDASARAHFAVFCALGKLVDAEGLGWRTLPRVRRIRAEIERAVALDPRDVDALVGKGALLLRLPRLLGGDPVEAERCLVRALALDPWHASGRFYLAQLSRPPVVAAPALSAQAAAK